MATAIVSTASPSVNRHSHAVTLEWSDVMAGHFSDSPARQAWRDAVTSVADRAKAALPGAHGRIDQAVTLVLAGDVELLPDGTAKVASQSNGTTAYHIVNGACPCKDAPKAPAQMCMHRLAYGIYTRAKQLVAEKLQDLERSAQKVTHQDAPGSTIEQQHDSQVPARTHAEAPASANVYVELAGRTVQITLRDTDETQLLHRLETLLARFPSETEAAHEPPEGWCSTHRVQMTRHSNAKGAWWSHKSAEGWCHGQ